MSDEQDVNVQCAQCGKTGYPSVNCTDCYGKAGVEARQYTATEIRTGKGPKESDRYGLHGDVGPKIVTTLPGSGGPGGS